MKRALLFVFALASTLVPRPAAAQVPQLINYQGRLVNGTNLANGNFGLSLRLFSVASGGSSTYEDSNSVTVADGLYSTFIGDQTNSGNFALALTNAAVWIEVAVNGVALTPREKIASAAYALNVNAAGIAGQLADSQLSTNVARLNAANQVFSGGVSFTTNVSGNFDGTFSGNGSAVSNVSLGSLNAPGVLTWSGNFMLASSPSVGNSPRSVVAADVNGDGRLDLISANNGDNTLTVLTNSGSGGFGLAATYNVANNTRSVTAADVNGDGKRDLICTSSGPGALIVLTNDGSGGFVIASTNSTGAGAGNVQMVVAADINADGKPDLISANGNSPGTLSVFTNSGSGGFILASSLSVSNNPFALTVADVNGDGWPDLISANNNSPGTLTVLTNNGSGGFVLASTLSVGNGPRSVTAAEVNGDGKLDLISANIGGNSLSVLTNDGSGGFVLASTISAGTSPIWVAAVDINGDGTVDLICANNTTPGTLTAVTNDGSGGFAAAFTKSVGDSPFAVIAADVNGDSRVDLVSANGSFPGTLSVLFNLPTFTGNGAGLTTLNASELASGTVADARLSANVPLLNGSATFAGTVTATSFTGDGGGLTNVSGTLSWQIVAGPTQQAQPNTGYLLTNDALVTVTLPTAPNLGDVVRISGIGAGGWQLAQNDGQSVLAKNLPGNGVDAWTPHESNRNWHAIASSADGVKLVAVVASGGKIYTSTDSGATWTPRDSNRDWNYVASSSDGSKLVAAIFGSNLYTSADSGATWTPRDSVRKWNSVASSSDGNKLVAVATSSNVYTSTDSGGTWTPHDSSRNWKSVASSSDGSKLVAAVYGSNLYTSTDSGTNWTARASVQSWSAVASSADGSRLVAVVSGGKIYTSADSGVTWTASETNRSWTAVASSSNGSKLVAVENSPGQIYTSTDSGVSWKARESNRYWYSVASSADGNKLVATDSGGQIYTSDITTDTTPGTAGYLLGEPYSAIELQYIGNGQFIPVSHEGTILAY